MVNLKKYGHLKQKNLKEVTTITEKKLIKVYFISTHYYQK